MDVLYLGACFRGLGAGDRVVRPVPVIFEPSPEYVELLQRAAERAGQTLDQYVQGLIAQHCIKLAHIERCQPKPREPRPIGRPPLSAEERSLRELAGFLNTVYAKLKVLHGPEYEELFGAQERQYLQLAENKDFNSLNLFAREQPWQKRR